MKPRVRAWVRRYLPCEVASTAVEFAAAGVAYHVSESIAAAAVAVTVGQFIGYYAVAYMNALRWTLKTEGVTLSRALLTALRSVLVEFGAAELLDTTIVRPIAFYAMPLLLGHVVAGWIAAKMIADVAFYACAIYSRARYPHLVAEPPQSQQEPSSTEN